MAGTARRMRMRPFLGMCLGLLLALAGCRSSDTQTGGAGTEGSREFRPFVFIHAGDPQIGSWGTIEEGKQRFIRLARLANELKPEFVMVVGDLVNDGDSAEQIQAFDEALAEFQVPVRLLPGNHDDLATYRRKHGKPYYAFAHNNCQFVCLDSTRLGAGGSEGQWRWLEAALQAARDAGRTHIILAMHHPPGTMMTVRSRLENLISGHGIRFVLAGHTHGTEEFHRADYTTYTVGGTGWVKDRHGFGYRVFRVARETIEQHYFDLDTPVDAVREAISPATQPAETKGAEEPRLIGSTARVPVRSVCWCASVS